MIEPERRIDIISFIAPINDSTVARLVELTYNAHNEGSAEVHLYISSAAGKIQPAFTAFGFFRTLRLPFHTHNVGTVETAALPLFLASDCRAASPNAKFLIHGFEWTFYRDHIRFPEIAEAHESLKADNARYGRIFNERTNASLDIAKCLEGPPLCLDAGQALAHGIITEPAIADPAIPELAKLWTIHG